MSSEVNDTPSKFIMITNKALLASIVLGMLTGFLAWSISILLARFVFDPIFCVNSDAQCAAVPSYSSTTAMIIAAVVGLLGLVKIRVFRPLLIVFAAVVTLWGLGVLTAEMEWYWSMLSFMVLFGLSYGAFVWVARIRSFWVALALTLVIIVGVRAVLVA